MKLRDQIGLSVTELLVSTVVVSTVLVAILSFYNQAVRNTGRYEQETKIKFLAEEEMEKYISIPYSDGSLDVFANPGGRTNYYEKENFLVKTHIVHIDPRTGEVPDYYPNKKKDDTYLKKITVSVARRDQLGGQVDLIYYKSP